MPKITIDDITGLGLSKEMFTSIKNITFEQLCDQVIDEQAELLEGRIGATVYASVSSPTKTYVARAEKCLVAGEMVQRLINTILGNAKGAGREVDISHEGAQKKAYLDEAAYWIGKIAAGETADTGSDFAAGVSVSDHFGGASA